MADFDGLRQFFGEDGTASITYEQLSEGIAEKGMKLADLSQGAYVSAEKFQKQKREFDEYKANNDSSRYADYDTIKQELEAMRAEKADREMLEKLTAKKVRTEFQRFVLAEIKSKMNDTTDFEKVMEAFLQENPQYVVVDEGNGGRPSFFKGSSTPLDTGSAGKKTTNQKMNDLLRNGRK